MYLYNWFINEGQTLPSSVKGKPVAINSYRGRPNGNALIVEILDVNTPDTPVLAQIELPLNYVEGLMNEYLAYCLGKMGLDTQFDYELLEGELTLLKEKGYTTENAQDNHIDRPEPTRRESRLRPERVVDEPLARASAPTQQSSRWRVRSTEFGEWPTTSGIPVNAAVVGTAVQQGQPVPDPGASAPSMSSGDGIHTWNPGRGWINTLTNRLEHPHHEVDGDGRIRVRWDEEPERSRT